MNDNNTPDLPIEYKGMETLVKRCHSNTQCKLCKLFESDPEADAVKRQLEECHVNGNWNKLVCDRLAREFQKECFPEVALSYAEKYVAIRRKINEVVFHRQVDEYYDTLALIYGDLDRYEEELEYRKRGLNGLTDEEIALLFDYDVKKRIQFLETFSKAEQGDAEAQFQLAEIYYNDKDLEKEDEAIELYIKAAEQGHIKAQATLGHLYQSGYVVEKDYGKALCWYTKAAEQGDAKSLSSIGLFYAYGYGVEQDYGKAKQFWMKAAEQGDTRAYHYIGVLYDKGLGVEQDKDKAMQYFKEAKKA